MIPSSRFSAIAGNAVLFFLGELRSLLGDPDRLWSYWLSSIITVSFLALLGESPYLFGEFLSRASFSAFSYFKFNNVAPNDKGGPDFSRASFSAFSFLSNAKVAPNDRGATIDCDSFW